MSEDTSRLPSFRDLPWRRYLVTGPQRSGTTIAAQIIAQELGFRFVDEQHFDFVDRQKFKQLLSETEVVIQCPTMMRHIHEIADHETCIVVMRRPLNEILRSQERIGWSFEAAELSRYEGSSTGEGIAAVKYAFWERFQRPKVRHYIELDYHLLQQHRWWVKGELRQGFGPKQTRAIKKVTLL